MTVPTPEMIRTVMQHQRHVVQRKLLSGNAKCPLCSRELKVRQYQISMTQLKALADLYAELELEWGYPSKEFHARNTHGDYAKLRHWGLLERGGRNNTDGRMWRVTDKGFLFLSNRIRLPRFVKIYEGKVISTSSDEVTAAVLMIEKGGDFELIRR